MFFYRIPAPDEVMLISGGKSGNDGAPFRVVTGHGAFVIPPFRKARMLTLESKAAIVSETCLTNESFEVDVEAVIVFHVPGGDVQSIIAAGQRFVREEIEMVKVTGEIFAGHLRTIVGTLKLEELITDRDKFEREVLLSSKAEMARIGLEVDSLKIKTITDDGRGYIAALSAPHKARLMRDAKVAQAEADRAAAEAQQESERKQADYARTTALRVAEYKRETDQAEAEANQAGPLADARAQQEVLEMQSQLAQRQAALREQELQTEVIKPAEAAAEQVEINARAVAKQVEINAAAQAKQRELLAQGDANAAKMNADAIRVEGQAEADREKAIGLAKAEAAKAQADAAAANDKVSLQQLLIENLPAVVQAAASGIGDANVTMLDGVDGYSKFLAVAVQQGLSIFDTLRDKVASAGLDLTDIVGD